MREGRREGRSGVMTICVGDDIPFFVIASER